MRRAVVAGPFAIPGSGVRTGQLRTAPFGMSETARVDSQSARVVAVPAQGAFTTPSKNQQGDYPDEQRHSPGHAARHPKVPGQIAWTADDDALLVQLPGRAACPLRCRCPAGTGLVAGLATTWPDTPKALTAPNLGSGQGLCRCGRCRGQGGHYWPRACPSFLQRRQRHGGQIPVRSGERLSADVNAVRAPQVFPPSRLTRSVRRGLGASLMTSPPGTRRTARPA